MDPNWFEQRVSVFAALGPVARLDNCKSNILSMVADVKFAFVTLCKGLGMYEMFPSNYMT